MKVIPQPDLYQCEICGKRFFTETLALECERHKPKQVFYQGQMIENKGYRSTEQNFIQIIKAEIVPTGWKDRPGHEWSYRLSSPVTVTYSRDGDFPCEVFDTIELTRIIEGKEVFR